MQDIMDSEIQLFTWIKNQQQNYINKTMNNLADKEPKIKLHQEKEVKIDPTTQVKKSLKWILGRKFKLGIRKLLTFEV